MIKKQSLKNQLWTIIIIIITAIAISLGVLLPKSLLPIYEQNIYNYLKEPLQYIKQDINENIIDTEIAYIYISDKDKISISDNLYDIIPDLNINDLLNNIQKTQDKIKYKNKTYYYTTMKTPFVKKIAITNDNYIKTMRAEIFKTLFLTVGITYIVVTLLLLYWSNNLINKIQKLNDKVKNIDNDNYDHNITMKENDELYSLALSLENMRKYLKEQEEYKNQLYQSISHDLKTPITVLKSYTEALEDGIKTKETILPIIKEQISRLELKVHSLLTLNKLNYMIDKNDNLNTQCDIAPIVIAAVDKFKVSRPDVSFDVSFNKKGTTFRGTNEMWETIIDNILENFIRYANKEISVNIKNKKIVLFNDGPNIDENVLNNIWTPYEKGVKGVFGLGLSIVHKSLRYLNYNINITNEKNGVKFVIN